MHIVPVIDLKGGLVVRGVAGRRELYRPLTSKLCPEPAPAAVARALVKVFSPRELYVADLDAIAGVEPDWNSLDQISLAGVGIWFDCGLASVPRAQTVMAYAKRSGSIAGAIVGLESVESPQALADLFRALDPELAVFSLDLREGVPWTTAPAWQGQSPQQIARVAIEIGFRRLVVLDVASVGVGKGPSVAALCRELHSSHADVKLAAGGGIRNRDDLNQLAAAGCDHALVASALHDGRLTAADVIGL